MRRLPTSLRMFFSDAMSKWSTRHSRYVSSTIGKSRNCEATFSSEAARRRSAHKGDRFPGLRLGSSNERPAFSRNRAPKNGVSLSRCRRMSSTASAAGVNALDGSSWSPSHTRNTIPSSDHIVSTSMPRSVNSCACTAMAQGA